MWRRLLFHVRILGKRGQSDIAALLKEPEKNSKMME
jgi:hypothetical protein